MTAPVPDDGEGPWEARRIARRRVSALVPYARNARVHSDAQVGQIAASIREFGFVAPIIVDENDGVIAGHGRLEAARVLGLDTVPVIVRVGLTEAQARAYRLADNRIALGASWDDELLAAEVAALRADGGIDLALTGFDDAEIERMVAEVAGAVDAIEGADAGGAEGADPADDMPAARPPAVTRTGDVWRMGPHRVMCGDATDASTVATLLDAGTVALVVTSPPYDRQRAYDGGEVLDWSALMRGVFSALADRVRPDAQLLVNLGLVHRDGEWVPYWSDWLEWMRAQGWRRFGLYAWDQGPGLPGDWNGRLAPAFELVFHFNRAARQANKIVPCKWAGTQNHGSGLRAADGTVSEYQHAGMAVQQMRIPDSVLRISRHKARGIEIGHPAVFPVRLPEFLMRTYTDDGDVVFDPFGGSGTTLLAAARAGRVARLLDVSGRYVDLMVARWRQQHPDVPVLDAGGRPFDVVAVERGVTP